MICKGQILGDFDEIESTYLPSEEVRTLPEVTTSGCTLRVLIKA